MTEEINLGDKLDKLASEMIDAANGKDVKLSEKMEVFKTVSNHYVNTSKVKGKRQPGGLGGPSMSDLRDRVQTETEDEDDETDSA